MARWFVIRAAAVLIFTGFSLAQSSNQKRDMGPRALALLELSPNGTGHLVPVAIMYNGDFFDASAYKADPIPMALESGTVYEAMRSGSSQGLFTVTLASQTGSNWIGTGRWQDKAALAAEAERRKKAKEAAEKPPAPDDDDSGPPRLLRRSSGKPDSKPEAKQPASEPAKPGTQTASAPPSSEPQKQGTQPAKPETTPSASDKSSAPSQSASTQTPSGSDENDPDRPRLERRDQPSPTSPPMTAAAPPVPRTSAAAAKPASPNSAAKTAATTATSATVMQEIPAISDAGGPDARSYVFPLKPGEDAQFRKKMLAQATKAIQAELKQSSEQTARPASHATKRTKAVAPTPDFQQVQLRFFDLSSSNQPLMVLEATAQLPNQPEPQHITLITRQDINGDLHNALVNITDASHLDAVAQMDMVDAVDADGDGRGELLFRETSDQGHAYSIYRVIGDQLYQLYESAPQ